MDKKRTALELSEKLLEAMELKTIDTNSAVSQCLRLARLIGDSESIVWLQYELGGYPRGKDGFVLGEAWDIGAKYGRSFYEEKERRIFTLLASEIESRIEAIKLSIGNVTTAGFSVGGEWALGATHKLTDSAISSKNIAINEISTLEKRLSTLRGQYYDYALKVNIELSFSNEVESVFASYKEEVDIKMLNTSKEAILKLQAIENNLNSNNPESMSQVLTTCRRLFEDISNELFDKHFPNYCEKVYKTKSNKELDITGDRYLNRLSAVIEILHEKSTNKTLIGSSVLHTIDWIENLSNTQCKGVHSKVTRDEALRCVIHTYICLGDILKIQE